MSKNKKETSWTEIATTVAAIIAIILSCWSLWQSHESISVAKESNRIALEANQFAQNSISPAPKIINGSDETTSIGVFRCFIGGNSRSGHYWLHSQATHKIILTNDGGKAISLVTILFSENGQNYSKVIFSSEDIKNSLQGVVNIPIKIEPGEAKDIFLTALSINGIDNDGDLMKAEQSRLQTSPASGVWLFYFSNDSTLTQETKIKFESFYDESICTK